MKRPFERKLQVSYYDIEESMGYLETKRYDEYCEKVKNAIKGRLTIPEIKRALGENCIERWVCDALDSLLGRGVIKECWGLPTRYERCEKPVVKVRNWNITTTGKKPPTPDSASLYGD